MKIKKSDLLNMIQEQNDVIAKLIAIRTERDTTKELLEVDLSSELTGSDLARAMFERGDNYIMCVVGTIKEVVIIDTFQDGYFYSKGVRYLNPKPINNQGEPLTASEAGL